MRTDKGKEVNLSGKVQNGFAWDARMMANVKLPWQLSFQATGRYSSAHKEAQGSHQGLERGSGTSQDYR